jgi:Tfp pilus assembly protein PilN
MINVNLLPPDIKAEIDQTKRNKRIMSAFWKVLVLFIAYLVIAGGFYYYFSLKEKDVSQNLAAKEEEIKKYGTLEEEAKKISERLGIIKKIEDNSYSWSGIIDEIMKVVPSGVSLKSVKIDSSSKSRNQISGEATSKTLVASLRDSLDKSDKFAYVDIETSTTVQDPAKGKEFENFTISFSLEKGALK